MSSIYRSTAKAVQVEVLVEAQEAEWDPELDHMAHMAWEDSVEESAADYQVVDAKVQEVLALQVAVKLKKTMNLEECARTSDKLEKKQKTKSAFMCEL